MNNDYREENTGFIDQWEEYCSRSSLFAWDGLQLDAAATAVHLDGVLANKTKP